MNSKKLVSLLSAGALVVSSFSGLMMNGGVAFAAPIDPIVEKDSNIVESSKNVIFSETNGYQLVLGETLTVTAPAVTAKKSYVVITEDPDVLDDAKTIGDLADGAKVTGAGASAATDALAGNKGTYKAASGNANEAAVAIGTAAGAGTSYVGYGAAAAVADATTLDTLTAVAKVTVGTEAAAPDNGKLVLYTDEAMKKKLNGQTIAVATGESTEVTLYSKATTAAGEFWKDALTAKNALLAKDFEIDLTANNDGVDLSQFVAPTIVAGSVSSLVEDDRAEYNGSYTVTLNAGSLPAGSYELEVTFTTANKLATAVFTMEVGAGGGAEDVDDPTSGKLPYAVFEAVDAAGTHYEDGKNVLTVQVPRAKLDTETENEYLTYVRETAKKTLTINAYWSASVDEREKSKDGTTINVTADNKVKNNDTNQDESKTIVKAGQLTVNDVAYGAWTDAGVTGNANSYALTVSASTSETTTNYTGKLVVLATGDVVTDGNGDGDLVDPEDKTRTYAGLMTIDVKVVVADSMTTLYVADASSNAYDFEDGAYANQAMTPVEWDGYEFGTLDLDNGETGIAALKWVVKNPRGKVTEDSLTYSWGFVKDNKLDGADSKWLTDTEANKVFELTGADTEKVKIQPNTSILGGSYILRAQAKLGASVIKETMIVVSLTAKAGDTLTVTVNTSKLEKGYIEVPAKTTTVEEVTVTATRASGADVTKSVTYALLPYATYVEAVNNNSVAAYAQRLGSTDITVTKGELKVKHAVEPGAYVVVALDTNLGNYGVDDQNLIQVKSANGVAVTGLSLDQPEVTITNLNSSKTVVATVLPVEYQANNYTKVSSKSAEVDALQLTVADPSVVDVWLNGRARYQDSSNKAIDNTWRITATAKKIGNTTITVTTLDGGYSQTIKVTVLGEEPSPEPTPEPEKEHKAGDAFTVDGVSVFVNADGKTLTVTDVAVVGKTATIPATVDGMDVTAIAAQAFKKSDAKTVYVKASVTDIEKGAFKKAKTKKIFFYDPAALNTVAKNAFKGANVKVVGVGGSFSESAASQLKKAGASKVKNNGTAK